MAAHFIEDIAVREAILVENLPTVRFIARRIHDRLPASVELDDLISAGTIGLMDSVEKFDGAKKVQFKTYAQFRIKGAILDSLREMDWGSRSLRRKAREIEEAHNRLRTKLGHAATEQEVADDLGMSLTAFQSVLGDLRGLEIGSLHVADDEDGTTDDLSENIADTRDNPLQAFEGTEQKRLLAKWIEELPDRERQVLSLYYYEELPMKEIGQVLGVVESRVSQLHTSAVTRLRGRLAEAKTAIVASPKAERRPQRNIRTYPLKSA
jgi:RNA polymerase sigma factor for flagellar operon FliA